MPKITKKTIYPAIYSLLYLASVYFIYKLAVLGLPDTLINRYEVVSEFIFQSNTLILDMTLFTISVLALYLLPLFFMVISTTLVSARWSFSRFHEIAYFSTILILLWLFVLGFNQLYFPWSTYTQILPLFSSELQTSVIAWASLFVFLLMGVVPTLHMLSMQLWSIFRYPVAKGALALLLVIIVIKTIPLAPVKGKITRPHPDIIFIGLDSIAPLHMQHNPGKHAYLQKLLDAGTNFSNSITPLARTYPAWTSILTGQYPVRSGARFNLMPLEAINHRSDLLPKMLQKNGYHTIYAQDERKFNNINESFGFDTVVGPRIGAAEFLLTEASDIAFLNIFSLATWSDIFFPSIINNRADYIHYSPDNFVRKILDKVPDNQNKPLFLAAHFCLAHYPYRWRDNGGLQPGENPDIGHQKALTELEHQVKKLLSGLKKKGRLENALLVILSDHGESMGYDDGLWIDAKKGDQLYFPETEVIAPTPLVSKYVGHGTDLLDNTQYSTLLSFQGFGPLASKLKNGNKDNIVSLVDILPTVLSTLGLPAPGNIDGVNLFNATEMNQEPRVVLAETGIAFGALSSIKHIDKAALFNEAKYYYTTNPKTGLLILKPEHTEHLIGKKDFAFHTNNWILAFTQRYLPDSVERFAILVHKPSGEWTMGDNAALIEKAPMNILRERARGLLGDELDKFSSTWVFNKAAFQTDPAPLSTQ